MMAAFMKQQQEGQAQMMKMMAAMAANTPAPKANK